MLNNKEIINKLTVSQKLSLLATGRIPPEQGLSLNAIPVLNVKNLQDINKTAAAGTAYPSFHSMAHSWDTDLIGRISAELTTRVKKDETNAVITPDFGIKTHVYKSGISEDPYLGGMLAAACAKGITKTGVMPVLANCSVSGQDSRFMDSEVNERVIRDYIAKPFEIALRENGGGAVMTSCAQPEGKYRDVNTKLLSGILHNKNLFNTHTVCKAADAGSAVSGLHADNTLLLNGNILPLETAYNNYLKLKDSFDNGKITTEEYNNALNNDTALSEEALDSSVDRFLDFAAECDIRALMAAQDAGTVADTDKLSMRASLISLVLLKNTDKTLPLKPDTKVAVIGRRAALSEDAAAVSFVETISMNKEKLPFEYTGYADGYSLDGERNDALITEASALACSSDAVLLFLGFDKKRELRIPDTQCLRLPANQLALADALGKTGKKIIAVISGEYAFDTSFDEDCSGLILLPAGGTCSGVALMYILSGEINPSGKLAYTYYDTPDEYFNELKKNKDSGKIKIGAFFGYRNYDTAGIKMKYPFGHGLSYTSFSYSGIKADADGVQFRIKNTGRCAGYETAQVYIGKNDSSAVRPLKELKGFERVFLKPGRSKIVNIKFNNDDFAFCDPADGRRKIENGGYIIYVGASVSDIRLRKSVQIQGQEFKEKKENISDYIQTETNIVKGKYIMQTKDNGKRKISTSIIIAAAMLIVAAVYDIINGVLGNFDPVYTIMLVLINLFLVPSAAVVLINDINKRKKRRLLEAELKEKERENEITISNSPALEKLFMEEFAEKPDTVKETDKVIQAEEEIPEDIGDTVTIKTIAAQLTAYMGAHGLMFSPSSARAVLSAMLTSRTVIIKSADTALSEEFIRQLCAYFSASVYIDSISGAFDSSDRLLFSSDENGKYTETALAKAMTAAADNKNVIHIAALKGAEFPESGYFLIPFVSGAANPGKDHGIILNNKNISDKVFTVFPNLWFFLILSQNGNLDGIQPYIAKNAVTVDIKLSKINETDEKIPAQKLSFQRFLRLGNDSVNTYAVSENIWKKLDKLESYVNARAPYHIENKEWRRLEKYTSVYLACGGTENDAVDSVISASLLPEIVPLINAKPADDDNFSLALEKILGEEYSAACMDMLKLFSHATVIKTHADNHAAPVKPSGRKGG